jgi:hypothetical protein
MTSSIHLYYTNTLKGYNMAAIFSNAPPSFYLKFEALLRLDIQDSGD